MSCKFDKDIIHRYVDNTIDPLELIVLKEHIAVCQDCKLDLELMSKLEDSMFEYFEGNPSATLPEAFAVNILDKCYTETQKKGYKRVLSGAWAFNKSVAGNASRYITYLPGSKLAARYLKKAGKSANRAVKGYVKNRFKKLIANALK